MFLKLITYMECFTEIFAGLITFFSSISTIVIAAFTIALFCLQKRQHNHDNKAQSANYKLALYEKRIHIFLEVDQALSLFYNSGEPSTEMARKVQRTAVTASFLFPDDVSELLDSISTKAHKYQQHSRELEPIMAKINDHINLEDGEKEKRDDLCKKQYEIAIYFLDLCKEDNLQQKFSPYLKLPTDDI